MEPDPENKLNGMINQLHKEENDVFQELVRISVPDNNKGREIVCMYTQV